MKVSRVLLIIITTLALSVSCRRQPQPLVIQVLRDSDAPFAKSLAKTTYDFALTKPRLSNGKYVLVGTTEVGGTRFGKDFEMVVKTRPELVILDSHSEIPNGSDLRNNLGTSKGICGSNAVAYLPAWVSGERREGAEMYLRFVESNCK